MGWDCVRSEEHSRWLKVNWTDYQNPISATILFCFLIEGCYFQEQPKMIDKKLFRYSIFLFFVLSCYITIYSTLPQLDPAVKKVD